MSQNQDGGTSTELFALYGFELKIPQNWRVELDPKATRELGDVAFHTPKKNRIFVSWGPLEKAEKRFKTLEEHREWTLSELKKARGVKALSIASSGETRICGHRALIAQVSASLGGGIMAPPQSVREMSSAFFYCPDGARYYVIYTQLKFPDEYPNFPEVFDSLVDSMMCHTAGDSPGGEDRLVAPAP